MEWKKDESVDCWRLIGRIRSATVARMAHDQRWHWAASRNGAVQRSGAERRKADAQQAAEAALKLV